MYARDLFTERRVYRPGWSLRPKTPHTDRRIQRAVQTDHIENAISSIATPSHEDLPLQRLVNNLQSSNLPIILDI